MIGAEYPFIWRNMLKSLPITVLVNLRKRYYHVRDNTLMIAWADDLTCPPILVPVRELVEI